MPAALLKQSKDFRFFTLRRRSRPSSEIASAAGLADACGYCDSQSRAVRRRPTAADCYRTPTAVGEQHSLHRVLRRPRPENHPSEIPIPARQPPSGRSRSDSAKILINYHSAKRSVGAYIAKIILRTTSARTPTDRCASCAICGRRRSRGKHTGSRSNRGTSCSRGWPDRGNRCCRTRSSRA